MDAAQFIGMKYRFDQAVKVAQLDFYVYAFTLKLILLSLRSTKWNERPSFSLFYSYAVVMGATQQQPQTTQG